MVCLPFPVMGGLWHCITHIRWWKSMEMWEDTEDNSTLAAEFIAEFNVTLWWTNIAMENGHRNSGFSHEKWWFSIAMLVHQRVLSSTVDTSPGEILCIVEDWPILHKHHDDTQVFRIFIYERWYTLTWINQGKHKYRIDSPTRYLF